MTLSDNVGDEYNEAEDLESFWQRSNDHRTVRFINRSSEWLELKGTLQIGTNRQMTTTTKIPPRNTYVHRFAGKECLHQGKNPKFLLRNFFFKI